MHSILAAAGAAVLTLPLAFAPTPQDFVAGNAARASAPVLPLPSAPLAIAGGRANLADVVMQVSELTGVSIRASGPALGRLSEAPAGLLADVSIAPEAAWSFFESLIAQEGFLLVELRAGEPRLMAVVDTRAGNDHGGSLFYRAIPGAELDRYADHHALLIETVVHLEHVDVRQLANSMRALLTDNRRLNLIPAGLSGSMVLQGTGANVCEAVRLMRAIDEAEHARVTRVFDQGETGARGQESDG